MAARNAAVHIALHDTGSIAEHVPALAQTLLRAGSGAVIVLREFQGLCVEFPKFAAGSFSLTTQFEHQRAYRFDFRRPAESLLEGRVVQLFGLDPIAQAHNAIRQSPVTAGATLLQHTLVFRQPSFEFEIATRAHRDPGPALEG